MKGFGVWTMAYECKIYDKNGKLKKILRGNQLISKTDQNFFNKPSTKKAMEYIKKLKGPKKEADHETNFTTNNVWYAVKSFIPGIKILNIVRTSVRRNCT